MADKEKIDKLKLLLKELFQFDNSDLDFGIYRIINIKRKEISEFIDKELFDIINEKIKTLGDNSELKKSLELLQKEIEENFGCNIHEAKIKYPETPKVKNYIDKEKELKATEKESEIEGHIYNDIIDFFSRYYDKGDFISKRRYSKENKYAIPYNGEEVYLYWANNDQYYIKTGENFKNYSFKAGSLKVSFELVSEEVEVEKGNIKSPDKKFFIFRDAAYDHSKKLVTVHFGYRGLTDEETKAILDLTQKKSADKDEVNEFNLKKINERLGLYGLSELQKKHKKMDGLESDKSELEWHLNKYTTKNTTDYFIHKNLKRFFTQELDFFIKNEMLNIDDIESREGLDINLNRIKVFKEISLKIIEFLAQIEDFQKMLWEKRKFVISTDYCMTLDYVPEKYYSKILENKAQLEEWVKLYSFDIEKEAGLLKGKITGQGKSDDERKLEVLKQNLTLVIDTKFYDADFKYMLLSEIDDLDEKITGILIKSENYQALNLLMNKYKEKIKCCYIDPPYNTGGDGFIYKDSYQNSSWLSMMEDRIRFSKELSNEEGLIFISIDDNQSSNLIKLMDIIYHYSNYLQQLVWQRHAGGGNDSKYFAIDHEYIISYCKNKNTLHPLRISFSKEEIGEYKYQDEYFDDLGPYKIRSFKRMRPDDPRPGLQYEIETPEGTKLFDEWKWEEKRFKESYSKNQVIIKKDRNQKWQVYYKLYLGKDDPRKVPRSLLTNIERNAQGKKQLRNIFGNENMFNNPKPLELIKHCVLISTNNANQTVLDYFAGSGTTGHAVLKLNKEDEGSRKFILVEMAEYFDTVLKPRILKVIYSGNWKDGTPLDNNGSKKQIIKYQTLEQYEDSLLNIHFTEPNAIVKQSKDYKIRYMLEFESKGSKVFLNLDALDNPFEYKLKFEDNNELKEKNIDLVETFNYLAGITVKSLKKMTNGTVTYVIVKGYRNEKEVIVIWRNKPDGFDPVKDKEFIEKEILKEDYDEILVNGNSLVKGAKSIDEIFKTNMFGGA